MFKTKWLLFFIVIFFSVAFVNIKTAYMAELYFNPVDGNSCDNSANWFNDIDTQEPAGTVPTTGDNVYISYDITGLSISADNIEINGANSSVENMYVSNAVTFNSGVNLGTVSGVAYFNQSSTNEGIVNGDVSFMDQSSNAGTISGSATFYNSYNQETINGAAYFNNDSRNYGTITGDTTFNELSVNESIVAGSVYFWGFSYNNGSIDGAGEFHDSSYNLGQLTGDYTFYDHSHNESEINGHSIYFKNYSYNNGRIISYGAGNTVNVTFENYSYNNEYNYNNDSGIVDGDVIFNNYSYNKGLITGDAVFNNYSYSQGNINGSATFYDASNNLGVVIGDIYNLQTSAVIYFGGNNGNWGDVTNWYDNFNLTTHSNRIPNPSDEVVVLKNVTGNTGINPIVKVLTISNSFYISNITITVTNGTTLNNNSSNRGIITSDVVFNDDSYNGGTVNGKATFYNLSNNQNIINGATIFNDVSFNKGVITGNVIFNLRGKNQGTVNGKATFNNYAYSPSSPNSFDSNQGNVTATSTYSNAINGIMTLSWGGAWGVGSSSINVGSDNIPIIDWIFNSNSINHGNIIGSATFNDSSENQGTVSGNKNRVYKNNISINRNFINDGPWTVTADGAIVNVYRSNYNASTTFQTLNGGSFIATPQSAPDSKGLVGASPAIPQIVITDSNKPVEVLIDNLTSAPTVDISSIIVGGEGVLPQMTIDSPGLNNFQVRIASSTKITNTNTGWNGIMMAPTITTTTIPTAEGLVRTLISAIKLGYNGDRLSFDKGVRLIFPGQAGEKIGYSHGGNEFIEINSACVSDEQVDADALAVDSECKINVGQDLVVWTKHFTTFTVFSEEKEKEKNTTAGSGSSPISTRNAYAEWLAQQNINSSKLAPETKTNLTITPTEKNVDMVAQDVKELMAVTADKRVGNFINNGTVATNKLGKGERAGVVDSFKSSFGRTPKTETDWQDIIKIANGRWPSQRALKTEKLAEKTFKSIYKRTPDLNNIVDNTAVVIISYGLRPTNRNINIEKVAIKSFQYIFKHKPMNIIDWDIVRAIAYSGATK